MEKQEEIREYKFSDSQLVETVVEKVAFINRDIDEFSAYGVTIDEVKDLEVQALKFAEGTTDIEVLSEQEVATSEKDIVAEKVREAIREVMSRVELKFGIKSAMYKKFGTDLLSKQKDKDLYFTAHRVIKVGTEDLALYADKGLTIEMLNNIEVLAKSLLIAKTDQSIKISVRDTEQEERVIRGNAIYAKLVKWTNLGQQIWDSKSAAKKNDYIIYNTPSGTDESNTAATPTP